MKFILHQFNDPRVARLDREIKAFKSQVGEMETADETQVEKIRSLVEKAEEQLKNHEVDGGWKYLQEARRISIWFIKSPHELSNRSKSLIEEASKISSQWRKAAIHSHLPKSMMEDPVNEPKLKQALFDASGILDAYFENLYFKITVRRRNLTFIFLALCAVTLSIPALSAFDMFAFESTGPLWKKHFMIEFMGVAGALLSMGLTFLRRPLNQSIPDQRLGSFITFMKPAIGAVSAFVACTMFEANFLSEELIDKIDKGTGNHGLLTIAFLAGFTERFFQKFEK